MDELDVTAVEIKATYDEIKAYILQKYGLKVSSLYIAQVKQRCGIIERKNYIIKQSLGMLSVPTRKGSGN